VIHKSNPVLDAVTWVGFWTISLKRDLCGLFAPRSRKTPFLQDINIEPTNLCNANCVFCGYQFQERPHNQIELSIAESMIASAKKAGVTRLGLTPIVGEPLVHRTLEEIIRMAVRPPNPLKVGVTTNGILLTPQRFKSLTNAGLSEISISMSFPDEEEYQRIYRSNGLKTLLRNLERILDIYRPEDCAITLSLRTPRILGWKHHPLLDQAKKKGWSVRRNRLFDDWSGQTAEIMRAEGLARRPNRPKILPCTMMYAGPHILSDGRATACGCRDLDGKGDLALSPAELHEDMLTVYSSGAIARLREAFRRGPVPAICQTCRHYNPNYEGETLATRIRQLAADVRSSLGFFSPPRKRKPECPSKWDVRF
jgi:hypothetical protein